MKSEMSEDYIKGVGIYYPKEIESIRKDRKNFFTPIREAFINAWEAIPANKTDKGIIKISLHITSRNDGETAVPFKSLSSIIIEDNGEGITEAGFGRLVSLRDNRKGTSNKGTGRVQFLHFFEKTDFISSYLGGDGKRCTRHLQLSKCPSFLDNNAILKILPTATNDITERTGTKVEFRLPYDAKDEELFCALTACDIKKRLLSHFLPLFLSNIGRMPKITIIHYCNDEIDGTEQITADDIIQPEKEEHVEIHYSKIINRGNVEQLNESTYFDIKSFKLPSSELTENKIFLVSNGAAIQEVEPILFKKRENFGGYRFQFFISGEYIDNNDEDNRGNVHFYTTKEISKMDPLLLFDEKIITDEDFTSKTQSCMQSMHEELQNCLDERNQRIENIKDLFLIDSRIIDEVRNKIPCDATDEKILQILYKAEGKHLAFMDSELKNALDSVVELDPRVPEYSSQLDELSKKITQCTSLQNRTNLSKYVSKRKIVLKLFSDIINSEAMCVMNKKENRIHENMLHDLFFKRKSRDGAASSLWIFNEEYIYFSGTSDLALKESVIDGVPLMDPNMSEEMEKFMKRRKMNRLSRRPDILLLPEEGKCIIIEFKAPDVDVSTCLEQVPNYATLLLNYSNPDLHLETFYGYLVGGNIDIEDIRSSEPTYLQSANFNFLYRPFYELYSRKGQHKGFLYTEILSYQSLLERAQIRNKIFTDLLFEN